MRPAGASDGSPVPAPRSALRGGAATIRRVSDEQSTTTRKPFDDGATSDAAPDREELTWELFGQAERELSAQIVASGWIPDLIIAIARGGLIPAGAIGYAIGIKAMGAMNVEFYTGIGETLEEPVILPPLMDASELPGKKVLVVDDVADSGKTLKMVMELLQHQGLALGGESVPVDARSAVIYRKPRSVFEPDYCWRETDKWINFPWSVLPVITPASVAAQTGAPVAEADQEAADQADARTQD